MRSSVAEDADDVKIPEALSDDQLSGVLTACAGGDVRELERYAKLTAFCKDTKVRFRHGQRYTSLKC